MAQALVHRAFAPAQVLFAADLFAFGGGRQIQQAVGAIGILVQDHIFHHGQQFGRDFLVHGQLPRIDNAHVQPGLDGVIQEDRMHGLAHGVVAAEAETEVADAAADQGPRHGFLDDAAGVDEVHGVVVVLGQTGGHGKNVGIKNHVFRWEAFFIDQNFPGALANGHATFVGIGLAFFVEGHDHRGGTIAHHQPGPAAEFLFAILEADGIDHTLALDALQPGLDDIPTGRIDHHRHARYFRIAGQHVQELAHGADRLEHGVVHVHVDDLSPTAHLLAAHFQGGLGFAFADQACKSLAAGHVGALAHVDEERVFIDVQRFEPGQESALAFFRHLARLDVLDGFGDSLDIGRRGAAATTDNIQQSSLGEFRKNRRHLVGRFVVTTQFVGQARVGVGRNQGVGRPADFFDKGPHGRGAQGAIQTEYRGVGVAQGDPEGLRSLPRQRAATGVGDGAGNPHRHVVQAALAQNFTHGVDCRLGVQRIKNRLDHEDVGAAVQQRLGLITVGLY